MSDEQGLPNERYEQVKDLFGHLELEEKARFLAVESVNTIVEAAEAVCDAVVGAFTDPEAPTEEA